MAQDILTEAIPARSYTEGSALNLARAALFGVPPSKVESIVELLKSYRGGKPNSLIMGGPMGWSWHATLDTNHHGSLAGPADAHRHSDLANIGIDNHHARDHAARHHSGGADALALGSIAGNLTDAQHGSRTVANAHAHSHLSGIGANDHHTAFTPANHAADAHTMTLDGVDLSAHAANADAHHAQAHTLASHSTKAHGELTGVTSDQHHAQSHTHASHTGIGANDHHAQAHTLASHSTKAHAELTGIGADNHHARSHNHSLAADGTPIAVAGVPNLPASKITSGRFDMARMPAGTDGYVLTAQGAGVDPTYVAAAPTVFTETIATPLPYAGGRPASTWTDLDLSAFCPAGTKAVLLRPLFANAYIVAGFRKNGSALARTGGFLSGGERMAFILTECDADRIIEYYADNANFGFGVELWGYWS